MFSRFGKARLPVLAFGAVLTSLPLAAQTGGFPCGIASNFNGTPMINGSTIWFNAVLNVQGLSQNTLTEVDFIGSTITFAAGGNSYTVNAPNAVITFDPTVTTATTTFDSVANEWITTVPASGLAGNVFLDGVAFPVPAGGLPGGINQVTWTGTFSSAAKGIKVQWQWAAAVYSSFNTTNYNLDQVKPVDDNKASAYQDSDHAGTPEAYRSSVVGGATGGGGANYTGSYSSTASCGTAIPPQTDPGIPGGTQNTAGYLEYSGRAIPHPPVISPHPTTGATITANELALFNEGVNRAGQLKSTCDTCSSVTPGAPVTGLGELDPIFPQFHTNSSGLGSRHNADQCLLCHAQPTLGGSGGFLVPNPGQGTPMQPENPLFRLVPNRFGKRNVAPLFERQYGPILEVRFKYNPDGTPDGGVHQLYVITGINNDPTISGCSISQPDFATQQSSNNLSFRIPLQLFGLGLIDSIQDREITNSFNATASQRAALGIGGHPNRSANDGTITRFGWKAQNKSITMFAGEAYNVEMGVSNELFPTATEENPACMETDKPEPNDVARTDPNDNFNQAFNNPLHRLPDWMQFQLMMRFMDAPQPVSNPSASAIRGQTVFNNIGCSLCHTPQMQTAPVMNSAVLENRPVNLFSDLLLHHMGAGLADDISQGQAGRDEFRTTPLWGVGHRMFFLHDGRTSDLMAAIQAHFSAPTPTSITVTGSLLDVVLAAGVSNNGYPASEANAVIQNFNALSVSDKQAILDFLRSL